LSIANDHAFISDWSMSIETFELLVPKLLKWSNSFKIIVNLDDCLLSVHSVPSDLHADAFTAFNYGIES
jgi:hypothetical protein